MAGLVKFDHLAVGVEHWRDGFPRFAGEFGGRWSHGGRAGEFAPCQLVYAHDMRIELITPGASGDGFMRRFLDRSGPGAHHITFKVPSLEDTIGQLSERSLAVFGVSMDRPAWREAFVHPKESGLGTLLQVAEVDERLIGTMTGRQPAPPGFPEVQGEPAEIAWIGLTVESAPAARELLTEVLRGEQVAGGRGWARVRWGTGHTLVIRDGSAAPGDRALWPEGRLGVAHVLFGPAGLDPVALERGDAGCERQPDDPLTGVPVLVAG
jgi:hypothetical protein